MKTILISAAYSDMAKKTIEILKNEYWFILLGKKQTHLDHFVNKLNISEQVKLVCECDISDEQACVGVAERLKSDAIRLDGIVNFAGGIPVKANIKNLSPSQLDNELKVRVFGNIYLTKHLGNLLLDNASIIMINGALAKQPDPEFLCGSISTGAVKNLAKALAKEFAPQKIRVNTINPCASETKMKEELFTILANNTGIPVSKIEEAVKSKIPFGRFCSPNDVANAVKFLLSDESSFISGVSLDVDGVYNPCA